MTLKVLIVADDLTGALDTASPFVTAGLGVVVAISHKDLEEALAASPDVLAVNTASRALSPNEAAARVGSIGRRMVGEQALIVLKKIDSRLKGNVGAESEALASGLGRDRLVVAPAVPDQCRRTEGGRVVGHGVAAPLPVAPLLSTSSVAVEIRDAATDADLETVVRGTGWGSAVAVGARGLGAAFARLLATDGADRDLRFTPDRRTLFAFASRDPITVAQIEHLAAATGLPVVDAPQGVFAPDRIAELPAVVRCTGDLEADALAVADRFGAAIASAVARLRPSTLVMGGGDTALAILEALGAGVVVPRGEAAPGLPWFTLHVPADGASGGEVLRCVVKSGGFGLVSVLSELIAAGREVQAT